MKKAFITLLIMLSASQVFAFQDYVILTDKPVKFVYSADRNIATIKPLYTIGNERNILILHCVGLGKTSINVNFGDSKEVLKIKVSENETKISPKKGFVYQAVDEPPYALDILEPPIPGGDD